MKHDAIDAVYEQNIQDEKRIDEIYQFIYSLVEKFQTHEMLENDVNKYVEQ